MDLLLLESGRVVVVMFLCSISDPSMEYMSDWLNIMWMFNFSQSKLAELVSEAMAVILHYITVDFFYGIIKFYLRRKRWICRLCFRTAAIQWRCNSTAAGTEIKYSRFPTNAWNDSPLCHTITQQMLCWIMSYYL